MLLNVIFHSKEVNHKSDRMADPVRSLSHSYTIKFDPSIIFFICENFRGAIQNKKFALAGGGPVMPAYGHFFSFGHGQWL